MQSDVIVMLVMRAKNSFMHSWPSTQLRQRAWVAPPIHDRTDPIGKKSLDTLWRHSSQVSHTKTQFRDKKTVYLQYHRDKFVTQIIYHGKFPFFNHFFLAISNRARIFLLWNFLFKTLIVEKFAVENFNWKSKSKVKKQMKFDVHVCFFFI